MLHRRCAQNNNNNNNNIYIMETEVVPVVIGALGSIPKNLHHLESLGIKVHVSMLQKSALLGTAHILRKVLSV